VDELRQTSVFSGIGRGLAKVGIVALAATTMGGVDASGALAQQNDGVYGGGMIVGSEIAPENVPVTEDIGAIPAPEVPGIAARVPGAVNGVMGGEELPTPVDLSVVGEAAPSPVDISAIFAGLNLPSPVAGEPAPTTLGPEISVGATPGGDASGTITMGGSEGGGITMGGESGGASGG
jgi:hypothetical protein